MSAPLTAKFARDDARPPRPYGEPSEKRDADGSSAIEYRDCGSAPFAAPTRKARRRFDLDWLIARAVLGETAPREALIEIVWRVGHSKQLRQFDEQTRAAAIMRVTEKLLGFGLLGLGLAIHFDVRRSGAFLGWLVTALRNAAKDDLRRKRLVTVSDVVVTMGEDGDEREQSLSAKAERYDAEGRPVIPGAALSDPSRDAETKEKLAIALAAVNEREADILLSIADGEETEEIAERLGISASRVRVIVAGARAKARAALAKHT